MITLLLVICLLLLVINFYFLILPAIKRKISNEKMIAFQTLDDIRTQIINAGLKMLTSKKVYMSFSEKQNFYTFLSKIKNKLRGKKSTYAYFNFPRAFLMNGLLDIYDKNKDNTIFNSIKEQLSKIIDDTGNLKFKFDKVDQALFGLVLLKMYQIEKEEKYLNALAHIEKGMRQFINSEGLILYRTNTNVLFVDTLGMICPFLYAYGSFSGKEELIQLANRQLEFYIDKGFDKENALPFHAFDPDNQLRLGPTNWGRGIGWFMTGAAYALKYTTPGSNPLYSLFKETFEAISNKLADLRISNSYWSQFVGHTNDVMIDSSVTFMMYHAEILSGKPLNRTLLESILKLSVNKDGFVVNCSGDTIYINRYATKKTKSELVQGVLLSILSKT